MTVVYVLLIAAQAGILVYFVSRGRKKVAAPGEKATGDDSYEGRRKMAITVTPQHLQLNIPDSETFVYGVIMDWNTGDSVMTLATYINGAANLFFSSQGAIHNGAANPNVGEAAVQFVATAQEFLGSAIPASISGAPARDCVRFYLLTNKQLYAAQEQVKHFDNCTSAWLPVFQKGSEVIAEMMN